MDYDIVSKTTVSENLASATINTDTETKGAIVDTLDFGGSNFTVNSGTITDGAYAISFEHGNEANLSDATAVDSDFVISPDGLSFAASDDDTAKKFGYIGKSNRFVRIIITSTGTSVGGAFGVLLALGEALTRPVD